ncbi:hypothetical protein GQ457_07G003390 [Hibiscus cannabinus]
MKHWLSLRIISKFYFFTLTPFVQASPACGSEKFCPVHVKLHKVGSKHRNAVTICATRRREHSQGQKPMFY